MSMIFLAVEVAGEWSAKTQMISISVSTIREASWYTASMGVGIISYLAQRCRLLKAPTVSKREPEPEQVALTVGCVLEGLATVHDAVVREQLHIARDQVHHGEREETDDHEQRDQPRDSGGDETDHGLAVSDTREICRNSGVTYPIWMSDSAFAS